MSFWQKIQKYLYKEHPRHGVIDQSKDRKRASKRKWTDREYNVQDISDDAHRYVKFVLIPTNYQHYHFVVHIKSLMEQGG